MMTSKEHQNRLKRIAEDLLTNQPLHRKPMTFRASGLNSTLAACCSLYCSAAICISLGVGVGREPFYDDAVAAFL